MLQYMITLVIGNRNNLFYFQQDLSARPQNALSPPKMQEGAYQLGLLQLFPTCQEVLWLWPDAKEPKWQ